MGAVRLTCSFCAEAFEVKPYREKTAKYCSRKCKAAALYRDMKERGYGLSMVDGSHSIANAHRKGLRPTNAFSKGHIPWNEGLRGIHLSPATQFTVGNVPTHKLRVGAITQRTDKNGTVRNHIKVSEPNVWQAYAVFVWEKYHGKVAKGHVIHHINKNACDDRIENLEKLTRVEHLERHRDDYETIKSGRFHDEAASSFF